MAALLSTRVSLRWGTDESSEPTDTLVLNVGAYFMDLRILKLDGSVDWSMAGERVILHESPLKCQWRKTIDSLGLLDPDEGTFTSHPTDPDLLLENGEMPCPHKNDEVTAFEEVWREKDVGEGPKHAWILQGTHNGDNGDGNGTFVGRVGQHFMVLSKREGKVFSMRREAYGTSSWDTLYSQGEWETLPSLEGKTLDGFEGEDKWKEGEVVSIGGEEYVVKGFQKLE